MSFGFKRFELAGKGLHTGEHCLVSVEPTEAGEGVVFASPGGTVRACLDNIDPTIRRSTGLKEERASVRTVEHLMASLCLFGISNARVTCSSEELPILDGSALPWCEALTRAGATAKFVFFDLAERVSVNMGLSSATLSPLQAGESPEIKVEVGFERFGYAKKVRSFSLDAESLLDGVAPARTFGFVDEIEELRSSGLIGGGDLCNALVLEAETPVPDQNMRMEDEPVRHKVLDAIGDFALLGGLPWAHIELVLPGHALVHSAARAARVNMRGEPR